jgi:hypothetical protein
MVLTAGGRTRRQKNPVKGDAIKEEKPMSDDKPDMKVARRDFLSGVGIAGAAAALSPATPAIAQTSAQAKDQPVAPQAAGYTYFKPTELNSSRPWSTTWCRKMRAHPERHRHRHRHLYRSRACWLLGQR